VIEFTKRLLIRFLAYRRRRHGPNSIQLKAARSPQLLIFCFLGEFGYELLNWQGKIAHLAKKFPDLNIVIAGRRATSVLYPQAISYFSIDYLPRYKASNARGYFASISNSQISLALDSMFSIVLRMQIRKAFRNSGQSTSHAQVRWIFSDKETWIEGVQFGANRFLFGRTSALNVGSYRDSIYGDIDLYGNDIKPLRRKSNLTESTSILIMRANRDLISRDSKRVDVEDVVMGLSTSFPVSLMQFESSRSNDTVGTFPGSLSKLFPVFKVETLEDQIEIVSRHRLCIFLSDGDLRSHTYIPPLCGKHVIVITTQGIVDQTSYVHLWNEKIFRFGGAMHLIAWLPEDPKKFWESLLGIATEAYNSSLEH